MDTRVFHFRGIWNAQEVSNWVSSLGNAISFDLPHIVNRLDTNAEMEQLKLENWRVTTHEMAEELKVSHGSAHHIIHEMLK